MVIEFPNRNFDDRDSQTWPVVIKTGLSKNEGKLLAEQMTKETPWRRRYFDVCKTGRWEEGNRIYRRY